MTSDTALLAAIERFERHTGRRVADELPADVDEAMIELFLIVNGYAPANLRTAVPLSVVQAPNAKAGK